MDQPKESLPEWIKFQFSEINAAADILKDTLGSVEKHKFKPFLANWEDTAYTSRNACSVIRDCHRVIAEHVHYLMNIDSDMRKELASRFPEEIEKFHYTPIKVPSYCTIRPPSPEPRPGPSNSNSQDVKPDLQGLQSVSRELFPDNLGLKDEGVANKTSTDSTTLSGDLEFNTLVTPVVEDKCDADSPVPEMPALLPEIGINDGEKLNIEKTSKSEHKSKSPKNTVKSAKKNLRSRNRSNAELKAMRGVLDSDASESDESSSADDEEKDDLKCMPMLRPNAKLPSMPIKAARSAKPLENLEGIGTHGLNKSVTVRIQRLHPYILKELEKSLTILLPSENKKSRIKSEDDELDKALKSLQASVFRRPPSATCVSDKIKVTRPHRSTRNGPNEISVDDLSLSSEGETVQRENEIIQSNRHTSYFSEGTFFRKPIEAEEKNLVDLEIGLSCVSSNEESAMNAVLCESDEKKLPDPLRVKAKSHKKQVKVEKIPELNYNMSDSDSDVVVRKKKPTRSKKVKRSSEESSDDVTESATKKKKLRTDKSSDAESKASDKGKVVSSDESARSKRRRGRNANKRVKGQGDSSDSENEEVKPKKKVRRRIRSASSESSKCESANDDGDEKTKGKKKIRKLIRDKNLNKSTKRAGLDEEERKKRVEEKQKLYNEYFQAPKSKDARLEQLVLDFDPETKEPILQVDVEIVKKLKPHQADGIRFMWNACFESVSKKGPGDGCILAHCMGLGKTLQTVAFLHTVLINKKLLKMRTALVICPLSTVGNWYNEFNQWLKDADKPVNLHRLWESKPKERADALEDWRRLGGVAIIHYDGFRLLINSEDKKGKQRAKPKQLKIIRETLIDPGADIVVCDEGHLLKNPQSQQSKAVNKVATRRRIVLTGTPLQNNLLEYHTMMQFVKPSLLGTRKEFSNRFVNPILNGQHKDSDDQDVKIMKRRAHVLHKLLDGCVQRLDYSVLTPFLPPKYEYAVSINLSDIQKKLYKYYLDTLSGNKTGQKFATSRLFSDYQVLVKIWTHPKVLTYKTRAQELNDDSEGDEGSLKDFIVDKSTTEEETSSSESGEDARSEKDGANSESDWSAEEKKKRKRRKGLRSAENNKSSDECEVEEVGAPAPTEENTEPDKVNLGPGWYRAFFESEEHMEVMELSGKLVVLMEILKTCESIGDKVLVFSQYITSLDLIEDILADIDRETMNGSVAEILSFPAPKTEPTIGRWRPGIEYFRIDGKTKTDVRQQSCDTFNQETASKAKLFLISTRAGGLGINLVGANRVVIFDASWNPSQDLQSIFRVYRFGQMKPCYVYRLLARGTMEEKIYNRQVVKLSLSCRVVDEQQIERHFHFDEIQQMYNFEPDDSTERPTPIVPKDRLLANLLISQKDWIFSYLEHDSLLENKQEEELTEEERKAAWEEYNNINEEKQNVFRMVMDPWTIQTAQHFARLYPGRNDYQSMATTAKLEVQSMVTAWDQIHNDLVQDNLKIAYRQRLDELFRSLSLKFGPTANWDTVLAQYPPKLNSSIPYVYERPRPIISTPHPQLLARTFAQAQAAQRMPVMSNLARISQALNPPRTLNRYPGVNNPNFRRPGILATGNNRGISQNKPGTSGLSTPAVKPPPTEVISIDN